MSLAKNVEKKAVLTLNSDNKLTNSVQAEKKKIATTTFLDAWDLRSHMAGHFSPWDVVFSCHQGPLAPSSWPPGLDPAILTVLGC